MSKLQEEFIGRRQEIESLSQWLLDADAPPITYIHDQMEERGKKGGIGKTWLMRNLYEHIKKEHQNSIPVMIDFFTILDRDGVVIAERVVQAIQRAYPDWSAEQFSPLLQQYHTMQTGNFESPLSDDAMADALAEDLERLERRLIETNSYLVLFFDTFEMIEYNPITAVLRPTQTFPDTYRSRRVRVIIAGRNSIDWQHPNWKGREREVITLPLRPFRYQEAMEYLQSRLYREALEEQAEETLRELYERTEGRPILVGLVSDVVNQGLQSLRDLAVIDQSLFQASLVQNIQFFEDASRYIIFSMAHIYHRFNAGLLRELLDWPGLNDYLSGITYQQIAQELPTFSFVRSFVADNAPVTTHEFVLHDEMRQLVRKYCWEAQDPDGRIRRELSRLAIRYYSQLIAQVQNEEKRHSYIVERLFHELFLNKETGFQSFEQYLNEALTLSQRSFARALLQEVEKFEEQFLEEQRSAMKLAEARILRAEDKSEAALAILSTLEQSSEWARQHRSDLLFEQGNCHLRLSNYAQARECFDACLEIEQTNREKTRYVMLLSSLGYIHRLQGRYDEAMNYYEKSLNVQRNLNNPGYYANLLNQIGNVLRLLARLEEALRYCKLALYSRRDLYRQGKISEYYVGLSLSTLGHIYHALEERAEEEQAYQEAFQIYTRAGDRTAIADTYNCLGRVWVQKGDVIKARGYFEWALSIASEVSRPSEVESHNRLGRLDLSQQQWAQATRHFETAVAIARQLGLNFELAENLLYLANALDYVEQPSSEQIREAKRIAREHSYTYLLALARDFQGDMAWRKKDYQAAFKHYRVACRYIAERGFPESQRALRKLNTRLLETPTNFLPGILDSLLSYWYELGLEKQYPQLPQICREVSRHMLL